MRLRFVVDEGVDTPIVDSLRSYGHDVIYIAETARGSLDNVILNLAKSDNRILMTRDKDFGELVFRDRMVHSGIILNRLSKLTSENKARLVLKVIDEHYSDLVGSFTIIEPNSVRIRKGN